MNELCRLVQQFESTWQPMPGGDGEVRRFHDWRSGLQLFDTDYRQRFDGVDGPGWSALTASFLYDHRVVLPTAIPPYEFSRSCGRERFLESRRSAFRGLAHMAPLVDSGDLLLIPSIDWAMDQEGHHPQWVVDAYSRAHEEAAESMRDSRWHQLAKEIHATPSVAEGAEIGFQVAHSVHAEYAAAPTFWSSTGSPHPYEEYLRYRRERVRTRMARASIDLQVYEAVRRVSLPGLRGLDAEALVSVRRQHDGFDEWRRALRSAVRLIESSPAQPEFVAEATEILNDTVIAEAARIRRDLRRSKLLRDAAREQGVTVTLGIAVLGALTATGTLPLTTLLGPIVAGGTKLAVTGLYPPRATGVAAVLTRLRA